MMPTCTWRAASTIPTRAAFGPTPSIVTRKHSDLFTLILDTFNDNENARVFWTNPAGVRGDRSISNDGYSAANDSWNTYWDVAAFRMRRMVHGDAHPVL